MPVLLLGNSKKIYLYSHSFNCIYDWA